MSNDDKGLILVTLAIAMGLVIAVLATALYKCEESKGYLVDRVWVDTEYCTPADGGLLCEVDPGTFE